MSKIKEISQELLNELFKANMIPRIQLQQDEEFEKEFDGSELFKINEISQCKMALVGIDIYHYSQFPTEQQMFIPYLFDLIYEQSWELIRQNYVYLFQEYGLLHDFSNTNIINYQKQFISTGDGGYQILPTPIHAIIFILTFATVLRLYNSDLFMRRIFAKIGSIEVRYAITFDEIYKYKENFFGASIINNSRILSKDKLNRLIIDSNTYEWFLNRIVGMENLMTLGLFDLKDIKEFKNYNQELIHSSENALIPESTGNQGLEGIKSIDIEKIGKIRQKQTTLEIYNLHIQAIIHYSNFFGKDKIITLSIGNLNTSGIETNDD